MILNFRCYSIKQKETSRSGCLFLFGADDRIRTGDLVLTKDALCLLSYTSV